MSELMSAAPRIEPQLGYAGDVSARDVWQQLSADTAAQLIDVRTMPEWQFAGIPNLAKLGKQAHTISYQLYPSYDLNVDFIAQLNERMPDKSTPLYFLCRGGSRSQAAAKLATAAGWSTCYNVSAGFDGSPNAERQRGMVDGWKASGLPWVHP